MAVSNLSNKPRYETPDLVQLQSDTTDGAASNYKKQWRSILRSEDVDAWEKLGGGERG